MTLAIDEAQLCPRLFPALKESVRIQPKPVRFTSRDAIRESLTGRIVTLELLSFSIAEVRSQPLPDRLAAIHKIVKQADLERFAEAKARTSAKDAFESYLEIGGLPGICFFRDASIREEKFAAHIDTLLIRDLFADLRQEVAYRPERRGKITHFRTRHGVNVPLVFAASMGTVGIVPTTERSPSPKTLGSALAFTRRFKEARVVIATSGSGVLFRSKQILELPYWLL